MPVLAGWHQRCGASQGRRCRGAGPGLWRTAARRRVRAVRRDLDAGQYRDDRQPVRSQVSHAGSGRSGGRNRWTMSFCASSCSPTSTGRGPGCCNLGDGPPLAHARGRVAAVRSVFRHACRGRPRASGRRADQAGCGRPVPGTGGRGRGARSFRRRIRADHRRSPRVCRGPAAGSRRVSAHAPRVRTDSKVRRWRSSQAAERARQAIAHRAIGWEVISGVMPASSASQAVSETTTSTMVPKKPPAAGLAGRRRRLSGLAGERDLPAGAGLCVRRRCRRGAWRSASTAGRVRRGDRRAGELPVDQTRRRAVAGDDVPRRDVAVPDHPGGAAQFAAMPREPDRGPGLAVNSASPAAAFSSPNRIDPRAAGERRIPVRREPGP